MRVTTPSHVIFVWVRLIIIFCEDYSHEAPHYVNVYILLPPAPSSSLSFISNPLNLFSSLKVIDQYRLDQNVTLYFCLF
jgi:hypothetical protein